MIINNYKYFIAVAVMIIIMVSVVVLGYKNIKPSIVPQDILAEGILQQNNSPNCTYKEYLLNINIAIEKDHHDHHLIIYPYIKGIGYMSFCRKDGQDYYKPGSIGSDGITEPIAINELKSKNIIEYDKDISLVGFCFPDKAGKYKARVYFDKLDDFSGIKNPVLVCVYREEKYGKELTWTKLVPIKTR